MIWARTCILNFVNIIFFLWFSQHEIKQFSQIQLPKRLFIWGELVRLRGLARLGEVTFILRSYGIFCFTAESLLRHCKKIVLITWLLSGKFYIFNMDSNNFIRLQQFYYTVYSVMNMITAFSILFQLHGILLILVLLMLDFTYLVVVVAASLKSNLERIPKHTHAL